MKSEFYSYNFEPDNIELLVYTGSGNEFIQYETEKFKNLRDVSGNIKPIFIASQNPLTKLNIKNKDNSELSINGYSLFAGLLEIQRNLSFPIYPSRMESLIGNLGCIKQKEFDAFERIYVVLPTLKSEILVTTEVDYENLDYEGIYSAIKKWLKSDELEFELMTFLGYDHVELMTALKASQVSEYDKHVNKILKAMFEKNKDKYLPYPFDEILLYWENCFYLNQLTLDFPIDFYETLTYGEYILIEVDHFIL